MTTQPDQDDTASEDDGMPTEVPSASPAYATPPPEGIPDADDD